MMIRRNFLVGLLVLFCPTLIHGQQISDFSYKLVDNKIEVKYTLGGESSDRYSVELFQSIDNFKAPLKLVTGDVGDDIVPGRGKVIIWDARQELGEFKGGISLKLKTELTPFVSFTISKGAKIKMGKTQTITWEGVANDLKLELYQNEKKVSDIGLAKSGNVYNWDIPKKGLDKGSNYRIKAVENSRSVFSESFEIKKKLPVYIWLIPVAVVGGVAAVLFGKEDPATEDNSIPPPIGPN